MRELWDGGNILCSFDLSQMCCMRCDWLFVIHREQLNKGWNPWICVAGVPEPFLHPCGWEGWLKLPLVPHIWENMQWVFFRCDSYHHLSLSSWRAWAKIQCVQLVQETYVFIFFLIADVYFYLAICMNITVVVVIICLSFSLFILPLPYYLQIYNCSVFSWGQWS